LPSTASDLEKLCAEKGLKMTSQRRVIVQVLADSDDHPAAEDVYRRALRIEGRISLATVYRTIRLLEEAGILEKHDFGDGRARYEEIQRTHHDHLIDVDTGEVIEFVNEEIESLQEAVARELGYRLTGHRHELYGTRIHKPEQD
jgi:Fur family ferric uptake transcriptional regulator